MLNQICRNEWCKQPFTVADEDWTFYDKVSPVFNGKKEMILRKKACEQQQRPLRDAYFALPNASPASQYDILETGQPLADIPCLRLLTFTSIHHLFHAPKKS